MAKKEDAPLQKRCVECGLGFSATRYPRQKTCSKECSKIYSRKSIAYYAKRYYQNNKEKIYLQQKEYRQNNLKKFVEYTNKWRIEHYDVFKERCKKYYQNKKLRESQS